MKTLFISLLSLLSTFSFAQSKQADSLLWSNYQYRHEQNWEFADSNHSPLEKEDLANFKSLSWYPVDTNFFVWASLEETPNTEIFEMPTTTERMPKYRQYGILSFHLGDSLFKIPIYQNQRLLTIDGYEDYLFFPFTDLSNAFGTYGGGRYLDVRIPKGDSILLDFNKAYNPLCAYNGRYSCPIPPRENHIEFEIRAGVRYEVKH